MVSLYHKRFLFFIFCELNGVHFNCDVVLTYGAGFVDGLMASAFRIFSPDSKWLESLEIGNEYESVFDMRGNLTNLL